MEGRWASAPFPKFVMRLGKGHPAMGGKRQKCDVHHGQPRAASFLFWPGLRVSSVGCGNHDDGGYLCRAADIFAWLLIGHALAKYPLQGEWTRSRTEIVTSVRYARAMTAIKQQIRFCATDDGGRIAVATVGNGPPLPRAGHWLSHVELDARILSGCIGYGSYRAGLPISATINAAAGCPTPRLRRSRWRLGLAISKPLRMRLA